MNNIAYLENVGGKILNSKKKIVNFKSKEHLNKFIKTHEFKIIWNGKSKEDLKTEDYTEIGKAFVNGRCH